MSPKKKEVVEAEVKEEVITSEDEEFADAVKPEVVEEVKEEVKPVEPEPAPEAEPEPEPTSFEYDNDDLQTMENERVKFLHTYRKGNRIKTIISIAILLVIVAGWLVPTFIEPIKAHTTTIALITIGVCIAGLAIMSFVFKKKSQGWIRDYFNAYYGATYHFAATGDGFKALHGDLESKITEDEFKNTCLYKDVYKVGSRYGAMFTYKNMECHIIDCAGQIKGQKTLETIFVGKSLRTPNTYEGSGLYLYFKGNERAIPPNGISAYPIIEETKTYIFCGEEKEKKYLTREIKTALSKIHTNKVLVDLAISIQPGKTYFMLGYEDSLMVVPMEKPFNPNPTKEFKENLLQLVEIAALFNK